MSRVTVHILSTAHDVADARLGRIAKALVARGAQVTLEGRGDPVGAPDGVSVVTHRSGGPLRRVGRALVLPFRSSADVLVVVDPDLVLTAWLAARVRGRAVVADVHEDYIAVARDRPWARGPVGVVARLVVRIVMAVAARADLLTVADDHVPPREGQRRLVVRNLPPAGSLPDVGDRDAEPRAFYVGDLRPSRGLHAMIDAVAGADGWSLDLVGSLSEADEGELLADLERRGLGQRVRLHGRLRSDRAWEVAQGAWVGLCLLESTPAYLAAMPTKVYEYLIAGLPVLATPLPRVRLLLGESGAGECVGDAVSAASMLSHWSAHPDELSPLRERAMRWADQHLAAADPFDAMAAAILTLQQDPENT